MKHGRILLLLLSLWSFCLQAKDMYFVTVCDTEHFPWVCGLIESIVKHNRANVHTIAVFDLGLTGQEIKKLKKMKHVEVHVIQDANPDMRKKFKVRANGRLARGWYSWKPVVFHQALSLFPYFLYIDSGIEVTRPLNDIFSDIVKQGYCLFESSHTILPTVTQHVLQLFDLDDDAHRSILHANSISAGIQGISRAVSDNYVTPMYHLAADITNFQDDGSAAGGFGWARHDQTLFSIIARDAQFKIHPFSRIFNYFTLKKHNERDRQRLRHAENHKLLG
jgi:hypothetical protein